MRHAAGYGRNIVVAVTCVVAIAVAVAVTSAGAAGSPIGSLTQLPGLSACAESPANDDGCAEVAGFGRPEAVAVSPDGKSVYVAGEQSLAIFARDAGGALTRLVGSAGCFNNDGSDGCTIAHGAADSGYDDVTVSPDGKNLYWGTDYAVVVFSRDPATGALTQLSGTAGCLSGEDVGTDPCLHPRGTTNGFGAQWLAFAPDGSTLYAGTSGNGAYLSEFTRNPATGALTEPAGATGCVSLNGGDDNVGACATGVAISASSGMVVSPDGMYAYALSAYSDSIDVFRRSASGALSEAGAPACAIDKDALGTIAGCTVGVRGMGDVSSIAISPDGSSVYVSSGSHSGVVILRRDAVTGALSQPAGSAGCISQDGQDGETVPGPCGHGHGLDTAMAVTVAPDGQSVYVAAGNQSDVVTLDRDPSTGALSEPAGAAGCQGPDGNTAGCTVARGLDALIATRVVPDGTSLYAVTGNGVAVFGRVPGSPPLPVTTPPTETTTAPSTSVLTPPVLKVGQLGVPNPLAFTPPVSTNISPLFGAVSSHSTSAAVHGTACSAGGCKPIAQSMTGICLTAIGGNADVAITASCLKLVSLSADGMGGIRATYAANGTVLVDGVAFGSDGPHPTVNVVQSTGSNGAQQFTLTGDGEVTFENVNLDQGQYDWTVTQLASGGFAATAKHGASTFSGAAPVPAGTGFNGLPVASATMPVFHSGHASISLTLVLPPELGSVTTAQPITVTNGTLAGAVAAGNTPMFSTGPSAVVDARNCPLALAQAVPSGPGVLTIPYPHLNYHGIGIQDGSLTIAGVQHFIARIKVGLPYPAGGSITGMLELYHGTLRFGCVYEDYGSGMGLPEIPISVRHIDLGFASDNTANVVAGDISVVGGASIPALGTPIQADGSIVLTTPALGSGNPWTLAIQGNMNVAGFTDTAASLSYASTGYLQAGLTVSKTSWYGLSLGPGHVSGAMDPSGQFVLQGSIEAGIFGATIASAAATISNIGIGACAGGTIGWFGATYSWGDTLPSPIAGLGSCESSDLGAITPAIEATCQQLQDLVNLGIPFLSQSAQAKLSAGYCVSVPGSGHAASAALRSAPLSGLAGQTIAIRGPRGPRSAFIFRGSGAAPDVILYRPDGTRITTPAPGSSVTGDRHAVGGRDNAHMTTTLLVDDVKPGAWIAQVQPGSAPVSSVQIAPILPDATVTGHLAPGARPGTETLRYTTKDLDRRKLKLVERAGALQRVIGTVTRASGTLTFTPIDGPPGRRTIVAETGPGGLPLHAQTVATYVAARRRRLPGPHTLSISAVADHRASASFSKVAGATGYQVTVALSDHRHWTVVGPARKVTIPALEQGPVTATVTVVALDAAGRGGAARTAKRRLTSPTARTKVPAKRR